MEAKEIELRLQELNIERNNLTNKLEELKNNTYGHLIGKYYRLSMTCVFFVKQIEYVTNSHIHVIGCKIYYDENHQLNIEYEGSESIHIGVVPKEISRIGFLLFLENSLEGIKENIEKHLELTIKQ